MLDYTGLVDFSLQENLSISACNVHTYLNEQR